ncbi:MAG: PocR ligand-binding domain-containing protein [Firmicutes bacterium]|nr:PocR ligand-binding domain-containing protein [Bacillota bacterium]
MNSSNSTLKSKETVKSLEASVNAFSRITGVPVTYYDNSGAILKEYSPERKICGKFKIYSRSNSKCRSLLKFAGNFSSGLGEPYIFFCRAGLSNMAFPLIENGSVEGYFIAGPFVMKKLKSSSISNFVQMNAINDDELTDIMDFAGTLPVFTIEKISSLSILFYNSVVSTMNSSADYQNAKKDFNDQITLGGMIRQSKKDRLSSAFPAEMTDDLINAIIGGKTVQAEKISSRILERLYVICLGDLDEIKTMILWITATIIKNFSGEERFSFGEFAEMDMDIINKINEAATTDELSETFRGLIKRISADLVSSVYPGASPLIARSLRYIKSNYTRKIKLTDISSELHVNPTYFSALFSQEMGRPFTDYILELRIGKAKDLLRNTNMDIVDISGASGFENQSYFTKIFRKRTGQTPRQYRQGGSDTE